MDVSDDASSGPMARRIVIITAIVRVAVGAATFARPTALPRVLGLDHGSAERGDFAVRMFAAREVGLGLGTLYAAGRGEDLRPWVLAQGLGDAGDAVALASAVRARRLWPVRTGALALFAAAGAGAAVVASWALGRDGQGSSS